METTRLATFLYHLIVCIFNICNPILDCKDCISRVSDSIVKNQFVHARLVCQTSAIRYARIQQVKWMSRWFWLDLDTRWFYRERERSELINSMSRVSSHMHSWASSALLLLFLLLWLSPLAQASEQASRQAGG